MLRKRAGSEAQLRCSLEIDPTLGFSFSGYIDVVLRRS
jgi:hypothetical protein